MDDPEDDKNKKETNNAALNRNKFWFMESTRSEKNCFGLVQNLSKTLSIRLSKNVIILFFLQNGFEGKARSFSILLV